MRDREKSDYEEAKSSGSLTPSAALKAFRELMGLTQAELATRTGIAQSHISSLETGRVALGIERARRLGKALDVHPVALVYPSIMEEQAALAEASVKLQVLGEMISSEVLSDMKNRMPAALRVFVEAIHDASEKKDAREKKPRRKTKPTRQRA